MANLLGILQKNKIGQFADAKRGAQTASSQSSISTNKNDAQTADGIISTTTTITNAITKPPIKFVPKFFAPHAKGAKISPQILDQIAAEVSSLNLKQLNKSLPKLAQKHSIFNFAAEHNSLEPLMRGIEGMAWLTPDLIQDRIYNIPYVFNPELKQAVAFANLEKWQMELHPIWGEQASYFYNRWFLTLREHFLHEVAHFCSYLGGDAGHGNKWRTCMHSFNYLPRPCHASAIFNKRSYVSWIEKNFLKELEECTRGQTIG